MLSMKFQKAYVYFAYIAFIARAIICSLSGPYMTLIAQILGFSKGHIRGFHMMERVVIRVI